MTASDHPSRDPFGTAAQLPEELWQDLILRPPAEAAAATGAEWEDGRFKLPLLAREYALDPSARRVWEVKNPGRPVEFQTGLVLLSALGRAQDIPPADRMVAPQELPGGSLFFHGPHAMPLGRLCKRFGGDPSSLLAKAAELGGRPLPGADAAASFAGLPRVPVYLFLWAQDEEFKASASICLDAHAHLQLALDGLWALCNVLVRRLTGDF